MNILGIETSCDETSMGILGSGQKVLANMVYSQVQKHLPYGGIVPEVASREHVRAIGWVYNLALKQAQIGIKDINLLAVTIGPGLQGPLLVGISFAQGLAQACNLPLVGVNHLMAHIYSSMIEEKDFRPPFLVLLVTGGHTMLVLVDDIFVHRVLGSTRDDAAGECLDKTARLLGLGYPGGPAMEKLAKSGNPNYYRLPVPLKYENTMDFSFSGLKTAVYYLLEELRENNQEIKREHLAASVQEAVFSSLMLKLEKACEVSGVNRIALVGGVAANENLKSRLKQFASRQELKLSLPSADLCTDNGAMNAFVGWLKHKKNQITDDLLEAKPFLTLEETIVGS